MRSRIQIPIYVTLSVCLFLSNFVFGESMSRLAKVVWLEENSSLCGQASRNDSKHYTATLNGGAKAEIIHIDCTGACGSGGCTSYIVVKGRVYAIFGSEPKILKGDGIVAIAWFGSGVEGCNSSANVEDCLLAMYWQDSVEKFMYYGADDVTDNYVTDKHDHARQLQEIIDSTRESSP